MANDLEKLATIEAAAKQKLKEIRQKKKALLRADNEAKKIAIGDGILRAIAAEDLSWNDIKPALQKHIKNKRKRALLDLPDTIEKPPESTEVHGPDILGGVTNE